MAYRRKGQEKGHTLNTRARITVGKYLGEHGMSRGWRRWDRGSREIELEDRDDKEKSP